MIDADGLCHCGRVQDRPGCRGCSVCAAQKRIKAENLARRREIRLEVLLEVEREWIVMHTSGGFWTWLQDQIRPGEGEKA